MAINVKNFVDVNIIKHQQSSVSSIRDTAVLFTTEGTAGNDTVFSSLKAVQDAIPSLTRTIQYATVFFNNGGVKLRIIQGIVQDNVSDAIKTLPNEQIVVALVKNEENTLLLNNVAAIRAEDTTIYGVNTKILIERVKSTGNNISIPNYALKYSTEIGAEMTIAAYLTSINILGINTVQDYCFTKEIVEQYIDDDDIYQQCMTENMNVNVYLANSIRNVGGNLTDGSDLVNSFMLIVVQQTLTDRLVNVLASKISGTVGLTKIRTAMADELSKYVVNGYLATDKIWSEPDLTIAYNNTTYTLIEQDTPLLLGYNITILPLSSLTDADKAARKTPPIYVILADSYGIRKIVIDGEVY